MGYADKNKKKRFPPGSRLEAAETRASSAPERGPTLLFCLVRSIRRSTCFVSIVRPRAWGGPFSPANRNL
jgi:hypothetical protein